MRSRLIENLRRLTTQQLGREAAADNSPRGGKEGHGDTDTPSSVKDKVGEKLTEKREDDREKGKTEDDDAEK